MCDPVAQWIRHLTTNQGIPGSNPGGDYYLSQVKTKKILAVITIEDVLKRKLL